MKLKITACFIMLFVMLPRTACAEARKARVGVTFSQVQCEYLGMDWRETYREVLALNVDILRLGAYWGRIEKQKGEFDFSELDWQIRQAAQHNVRVLLTVGMKAPRWPEYFIPAWLAKEADFRFGSAVSDRPAVAERALIFISKVIERYKDEEVIIAWQVENEPFSRAGPKELWIRGSFLKNEVDLVRELDGRGRPVVLNAMTYANGFLRFFARLLYVKNPVYEIIDIAQIPALNVYPAIGHKVIGTEICFWTTPRGRIAYLRRFVDHARRQNKSLWVTELQAEPWEPGELVHTGKAQPVTCGADRFIAAFDELRSLGIDTVFLWGVEYWLYRKHQHDDPTWVNAFDYIAAQQ